MSVDTDMYIKPEVESTEIIGINMYKALRDIYTKVREDKQKMYNRLFANDADDTA